MDIFLTVLGAIMMLAGLAGCILPFLPGPPLSFSGLLLLQFTGDPPFTVRFLVIWGIVSLVVTLFDYVIPVYGTKRFGGTRNGMWGCTIGLIVGIWAGPVGIIFGPFIGAFIGEMTANNDPARALKPAIGSFVGFLTGTLLKLVVCVIMTYHFVAGII